MSEAQSDVPAPVNQRRLVRILLYVLLVASAGATFLIGDRLWAAARLGSVPMWAPLLAPCLFTLFTVVYALDRFTALRRRRTAAGRAFLQVGFAVIFLTLLWPQQATEYRQTRGHQAQQDYALLLLDDSRPHARAAGCELIGLRAQINAHEAVTEMLASETDTVVLRTCRQALERLSATPATPPSLTPTP